MKFAVDASVVVKWYVSENHSEEARLLLGHRLERHAPDFLLVEFANTVWKKARRGEIADPAAYFGEIPELREAIDLHPDSELIEHAAELSSAMDHPVYDCLYFACAVATGSTLITADRKFADRAASKLPNPDVRYIGEDGVADEIGAAATSLVISRDNIEELVAEHDRLAGTDEHVRSALYGQNLGRGNMDTEDLALILRSPAGKRLKRLLRELTEEERIDLVALAWLGAGAGGTDWQSSFEHACKVIGLYDENNWAGVLNLGVYWRAGYERLTGNSI
ncbi:MAG: PIN domain-containing protein [Defluviicoccus sp.]|nr:PIN domain-containing protein [Defluviicoccus sp.]MDE0278771.1 PIN domain-containing protein [Defluviicoccus sp.]